MPGGARALLLRLICHNSDRPAVHAGMAENLDYPPIRSINAWVALACLDNF